ncbi:MAG: bifunctional DNA-formamidopyrimidine glycosylase/DNA-(apurinic or apyrimidinic site) lyase [Elusimicrobiota bacterium]|nr:bifunctional DNA-formamidopyrimidine glycosylase/DNA-(apurinic or apyrimidinic site) lyase [Elusimicrobiota bacterium]
MPELPEAETVRRVLTERYAGKVITSVRVGRPTFYRPPPRAAVAALEGATLKGFARKGKFLLAELEDRPSVVFHLGMSGRLTVGGESPHVRFEMTIGGENVRFHDARRFGRVGGPLPALGPEPLETAFDAAYLWKVLRGRAAPVKALIMDQKLVAGLGNIYATEALHLAEVRPGRAGGSLRRAESDRLAAACRTVLLRGVELGGSTLDDESFLDPLGRPGRNQRFVKVYGRADCASCGGPTLDTRRSIGGRSSRYCPSCQR